MSKKKWDEMSFEEQMQSTVQEAILRKVREASFVEIDYKDRPRIPKAWIDAAWAQVDWPSVQAAMTVRMTEHVADSIYNKMATEIASDVKQIMSNNELREDVRALIRAKIREAQAALTVLS